MKILALIGSPRIGSNTDILVDHMLEGAQSCGLAAKKIYLYDYQILPCLDCRKCKKDDFTCALKDGMSEIYLRFEEADLIIFGTPVYWYGPTAKMKLLIDRMRPFIASGRLKGKRGIVVTPSEEGGSCSGPLTEMFLMSFKFLGMTYAGSILAKAYERGEVRDDEVVLKKAYELGASL
jgi:multimeric flavodoxin WrbA